MLKSFFHYVCILLFWIVGVSVLGVLYWLFFEKIYGINIASPITYQKFSEYWDNGGVLRFNDVVMLLILCLFIPISLFYMRWLNRCKFLNLILLPVQWLQNRALKNYKEVSINIKNLKVEEKKTIEQLVEERIEEENKNRKNEKSMEDFRKKIINKINSEKKEKSS